MHSGDRGPSLGGRASARSFSEISHRRFVRARSRARIFRHIPATASSSARFAIFRQASHALGARVRTSLAAGYTGGTRPAPILRRLGGASAATISRSRGSVGKAADPRGTGHGPAHGLPADAGPCSRHKAETRCGPPHGPTPAPQGIPLQCTGRACGDLGTRVVPKCPKSLRFSAGPARRPHSGGAEARRRASVGPAAVRRGGGEGGRICCDSGPDLSGSWRQRPLCHVQCPVANLSRLQRILPIARSKLQFRASVPAVYVTGTAQPTSRAPGGRGPYYRSAGERWAQAPHF